MSSSNVPEDVDTLKAQGIQAYKNKDLTQALSLFQTAITTSSTPRCDIKANIASTLFEMGDYAGAADAAAEAHDMCVAADDTRRAERMKTLTARLTPFLPPPSYPSTPPRMAMTPPVRPPARDGWSYFAVGHEDPISFVARKGDFFVTSSGDRSSLIVAPFFFQDESSDGVESSEDFGRGMGYPLSRQDLDVLAQSKASFASPEETPAEQEFRVILAASSDPRHVLKTIQHMGSALQLGTKSDTHFHVNIIANDFCPDTIARQVVIMALLHRTCTPPPETGRSPVDFTALPGLPPSPAFTTDEVYFAFVYHFFVAHNFSHGQAEFLDNVLTALLDLSEDYAVWSKAWEGKINVDPASLDAIRAIWKKWHGRRYDLWRINRERAGSSVFGLTPQQMAMYGIEIPPIPEPQPVDMIDTLASQYRKGRVDEEMRPDYDRIISKAIRFTAAEMIEAGNTDDATAFLAKAKADILDRIETMDMAELAALGEEYSPANYLAQNKFDAQIHLPRIVDEQAFYERTGLLAPIPGMDPATAGTKDMGLEEVERIYYFNSTLESSAYPAQKIDKMTLDPLNLLVLAPLKDDVSGTIAYQGMNHLRTVANILENLPSMFSLTLSFSVKDMYALFTSLPPASVDRIFVSNVPDYTGWLPIFTTTSPILRPGPETFLSGTCLKNPPLWTSFSHLIQTSVLAPLGPLTTSVFGHRRMWGGSGLGGNADVGFEFLPPAVFPGDADALPIPELLEWVKRTIIRAAHACPMGTTLGAAKPMEVTGATVSAHLIHHLVTVNKVPPHVFAPLVSAVFSDEGIIWALYVPPSDRVKTLASCFRSEPVAYSVGHFALDFGYALRMAWGGPNAWTPFDESVPSVYFPLVFRAPAFVPSAFDLPVMQAHILSYGGDDDTMRTMKKHMTAAAKKASSSDGADGMGSMLSMLMGVGLTSPGGGAGIDPDSPVFNPRHMNALAASSPNAQYHVLTTSISTLTSPLARSLGFSIPELDNPDHHLPNPTSVYFVAYVPNEYRPFIDRMDHRSFTAKYGRYGACVYVSNVDTGQIERASLIESDI